MGVTIRNQGQFKKRTEEIKMGLREGLAIVAEVARDEIVRSTLAGLGKNDQPFAPYSKGYAEQIAAVGGKSSGVVDLRGIFVKAGKRKPPSKISKLARRRGAGRQSFARVTIAGRSFFAKTKQTRARMGVIDKESEMSADLITVVVEPSGYISRLIYRPRRENYMILHNEGTGSAPQREWFSVEKASVVAATEGAMQAMFSALVREANR